VNWRARPEPILGEPLSDDPWPVAERKLLTERERSLYQSLLTLYPDHKLFIQVALSQLVDVHRNHPDRESIRNRYKQLVADFVLCRSDLSVVAVVELDDRSHERADRRDADARKNKAFADAGIRLIRIPAGKLPPIEKLRELVDTDRPLGDRTDIPTLHGVDPELRLVEEADDPSLFASTDNAESNSRVFKQVILKIILGGVFIAGGWLVYNQILGFAVQRAFRTLAVSHVVTHTGTASSPHSATLKPTIVSVAPSAAGSSAAELAAEKQQSLQTAKALQKKKDQAWAAFYTPPASCEHPMDWRAQVECGNQYMRAKKLFEQRWEAEQPASQAAGAGVVLDNGSVEKSRK
jgi:hypothetical protein